MVKQSKKSTGLDDLSPKRRRKIEHMITFYNKILAEKTPKGNAVHSFEYAVEKCAEKFYYTEKTVEYYIKVYG